MPPKKTDNVTPAEISILRWHEAGESLAVIADKPSVIQHLGDNFKTTSQRVANLKRVVKRVDWFRFERRRKGLSDFPEPSHVVATPQPLSHSLDSTAETLEPDEEPQTEFGKLAAELLRPILLPKLGAPRRVFQFPSGAIYESAHHPLRPGAPVDVRYEGGVVRKFVDAAGQPVVIVNVHRTGYSDETLNEETGEWILQR